MILQAECFLRFFWTGGDQDFYGGWNKNLMGKNWLLMWEGGVHFLTDGGSPHSPVMENPAYCPNFVILSRILPTAQKWYFSMTTGDLSSPKKCAKLELLNESFIITLVEITTKFSGHLQALSREVCYCMYTWPHTCKLLTTHFYYTIGCVSWRYMPILMLLLIRWLSLII